MIERVYLDHHATTPMDPVVVEAMMPYYTEQYGNPHSVGHVFGEEAREAVAAARSSLARNLGVHDHELVFTSGATESNNLALRGVAERFRATGGHFVSVTTEHKAVLDPLVRLERMGCHVTLLRPMQWHEDHPGWLDPQQVHDALQENTKLVSVMLANNEIGVLQPIQEITELCHAKGVLVHCDATQAVGKIPVDAASLDVDLLSFSGHKVYGPRGVGCLVVRRRRPRIKLTPLFDGGGQEQGLRSGTLNVPGIVGLATAVDQCLQHLAEDTRHLNALRETLFHQITAELPDVALNGPSLAERLVGNLNLSIQGVDSEALMLNVSDVAFSSGSACTSANPEPSHVLRALGLSEDATRSSIRFGIGRFNTEAEIHHAATRIIDAARRLRGFGSTHAPTRKAVH